MKIMKVFKSYELSGLPEALQNKIWEKMNHCGGTCDWYPGDGFYKPQSEVVNPENVLTVPEDENDYVYEKGDDIIGDWFLDNGCAMDDEILIIR